MSQPSRSTAVTWGGAVLAVVLSVGLLGVAQTSDVRADYERATSLPGRVRDKVYDAAGTPTWIPGASKFWYSKSVRGGNEFVLVDAVAATKTAAFDHTRLAAGISTAANGKYTALTLPFSTFTYTANQEAIEFVIAGGGGPAAGAPAPAPPVTTVPLHLDRLHMHAPEGRDAECRARHSPARARVP